ncbi:uncharacterized protein LOC132196448 [Neocloeon triangulifer]|uniref:uncharacterized protein LOC132196448 n=1 Tax=Neocloeon triangulifer TaxID=2078957 RepID=UPI00286ED7C8|nr:uncharacterized protein LOC132196448 [Neocloeon triangulifer]
MTGGSSAINMADIWTDKKFLLFLSGAVLQASAFVALYLKKQRNGANVDEGFEDVSRIEDEGPEPEKKILVLGLESSGKSSILAQFTAPHVRTQATNSAIANVTPTEGFNAVNLINDGVSLKIYELGGGPKVRQYWDNYLQDTDVLIFVVDSTQSMTTAATELKRLLGDERLNHCPVLIFANKQDKPGALTPEQVADALDLNSIAPSKHQIKVFGTQCTPKETLVHPSILHAKSEVFRLASN